ncbi:MAG: PepSY-like domain-containing protein [Bacteroides sp.]|nr:PepSY-like domain-containing protein [Bacteroides sp.]
MKKFLSILVLALVAVQFACAGDVITQDANRLPQPARQFISKYFPNVQISHIKIDSEFLRGEKYEVLLTDRTEIDFDSKGNWQEVDCKKKAVPAALIPTNVKQYVEGNFPREIITKVDRRHGVEVELGNDFSLKFNKKGKFVGMDD